MSTVSEPAGDQPASEPWREKYKRQYLQLKGLGWEGMMLDKIMRQNAIARDLARRTADGSLGTSSEAGMDEDDMGVRIGDEVHHHHAAAPPPGSGSTGMGTLGTAAAVVALLAAGSLPTAAATWWLSRPAPPAIEQPAPPTTSPPSASTDNDTRYGLEVSSSPGPPD